MKTRPKTPKNKVKVRNPAAKALRDPVFKQRIVASKKAYNRKALPNAVLKEE